MVLVRDWIRKSFFFLVVSFAFGCVNEQNNLEPDTSREGVAGEVVPEVVTREVLDKKGVNYPVIMPYDLSALTYLDSDSLFASRSLGGETKNLDAKMAVAAPYGDNTGSNLYRESSVPIRMATQNNLQKSVVILMRTDYHSICTEVAGEGQGATTKDSDNIVSTLYSNLYVPSFNGLTTENRVPSIVPRRNGQNKITVRLFYRSDESLRAPLTELNYSKKITCEDAPVIEQPVGLECSPRSRCKLVSF